MPWSELAIAVMPLIVGAVLTWRLPTLERRLRGHVALLKDVPAQHQSALSELIGRELKELVARDRGRLSRNVAVGRVVWLVIQTLLAVGAVVLALLVERNVLVALFLTVATALVTNALGTLSVRGIYRMDLIADFEQALAGEEQQPTVP